MARVFEIDNIDDVRRRGSHGSVVYFIVTPYRNVFQPSRELPVCHECARAAFGEDGNTITVGAFDEGDDFECDCGNVVESTYGPVPE